MNDELSDLLNVGVYEEMREQRLQQLREEFEASRHEVIATIKPEQAVAERWLAQTPEEWLTDDPLPHGIEIPPLNPASPYAVSRDKALRYLVAQRFNVFEDGKWQMLAKLTWGGA